jgi:hypothetical protein
VVLALARVEGGRGVHDHVAHDDGAGLVAADDQDAAALGIELADETVGAAGLRPLGALEELDGLIDEVLIAVSACVTNEGGQSGAVLCSVRCEDLGWCVRERIVTESVSLGKHSAQLGRAHAYARVN